MKRFCTGLKFLLFGCITLWSLMKCPDLSKKCLDCCYQINCQNMKKCWKQCCPVLGQSLLSAMAIPGTKTLQVTICNMKEGYLTPFITCIYQRKCSLSGRICLFDRSLWTYSWRSSTFVIGFGALLFIFVLLRWNWILVFCSWICTLWHCRYSGDAILDSED